jgi:hypothetical protein
MATFFLDFLIQNLERIFKSYNKGNRYLLQKLQIHNLFAIFGAWKVHLLIDSIQVFLKQFK